MKNEGAGLGLSICKHIMEEHNDSITFKRKQNVETTYTLYVNSFYYLNLQEDNFEKLRI
ncbi:ATP-binding protein [Lysinibacillus sp. JNUCC 51]|uniref:ATP-binding protein n=1 Tax=Lysinibacillus sp. JNUCC-51 TaxID=2792479 RepID=UPI00193701BB|nr:sensor histidine kinase [Lysinibacillus sp. JNUCC-51]